MKTIVHLITLISLVVGNVSSFPVQLAQIIHSQDVTVSPTPTPINETLPTPTLPPIETPTAVAADGPTATPFETLTPTPVESTETPTDTPTPFPTDSSPSTQIVLSLSVDSSILSPSGQFNLNWEIQGITLEQQSFVLQVSLPQQILPKDKKNGTFDLRTRTLVLPVQTLSGKVSLQARNVEEDIVLTASLLERDKVLATSSITLPLHEQFPVSKQKGLIIAKKGKIKIHIPDNAFTEDALLEIGTPFGSARPPYSLSGHPFEIKAKSLISKQNLTHFDQEIGIEVSYADLNVPAENEIDLRVYWYNPDIGGWEILPTIVDKDSQTLYATTNHFSVFDIDINNWQASHLPTVDAFQVSTFTGAATYSYPIEVPAGPGGLKPDITLSYNSQVVDQSTLNTQASWVGMGWSLESGAIERDIHSTSDWKGDDTFLLNVAGISTRIVKDPSGNFHTSDENFWKINYDSASQTWTIWDKQGTIYYFGEGKEVKYPIEDPICGHSWETYRWPLSRITNIFGKSITYTYTNQTKTIRLSTFRSATQTCEKDNYTAVTATYLQKITYGPYQIKFMLSNRQDYPLEWDTDYGYHAFEKSKLTTILVEEDFDNDGTFNLIRKYVLSYADNNTPDVIFPGYVWTAGGKTTTLKKIQQFGQDGTSALPATTFNYADNLHLTQAENGYGGKIVFEYELWYYTANSRDSYTIELQFGKNGNPCYRDSYDPWYARTNSEVSCGDGNSDPLNVHGIATAYSIMNPKGSKYGLNSTRDLVRPGGVYKLTASRQVPAGMIFNLGIYDGKRDNYAASGGILILPKDAKTIQPLINASGNGFALVYTYKFQLLPSVYRVKAKHIYPTSDASAYTFQYTYVGAAVNDAAHSSICPANANTNDCQEYFEPYSEFRGHSQVTEIDPYGRRVITTYAQDDDQKGRPLSTSIQDTQGKKYNETLYTYQVTPLPIAAYSWGNVTPPFIDLKRSWVYTTTEEKRTYENNNTWQSIQSIYYYNSTYGNLIKTVEKIGENCSPLSCTLLPYRTTLTDYFPQNTTNIYLVSLPARQVVKTKDGDISSTDLSETLYIYDSNTTFDAAPTQGKLSAVRTWVYTDSEGKRQYSETRYTYDSWGNQTSVTTYSKYGLANASPSGDAYTTYTFYENDRYPVYPKQIKKPLNQTTDISYILTLGVPSSEKDPNGATTFATYDVFGRITSLQRPGDSSPTLTISYQNSPFVVTLSQQIDDTHTYTVTRHYDGMGRQILVNTNGILVTSTFNAYGKQLTQSTPHNNGENYYNTTTTYDVIGRPLTITAPDGTKTTYTYNGLTTTVTDANGHSTTTEMDVWGRTKTVTPPTGPTVTFTYDPLGNMLTASRDGATTTLTYDHGGRKTSMSDPDMGFWQYSYDALGNLISQTDARGCTLTMTYDLLNRLTSKASSGAACGTQVKTTYTYDAGVNGIGRRTSMADASGSTSWTYDARGRLITEVKQITGVGQFVTEWTYNAADLPVTMKYPGGEVVTTTYDNRMLPVGVSGADTYVSSMTYDSASRLTARTLGNGLTQTFTYYPWTSQGGRLQTLATGSLQNLTYAYDANGNILSIADTVNSETQTYAYDALDRLTSWTLNGSPQETYDYDPASGNLILKGDRTLTYTDTNHVHAVTSASNSSSALTYQYDANGNQTTRVIGSDTFTLLYDAENRLVEVKKNGASIAQFVYDGDGKRVKSVINGEITYFIGNYYEQRGSTITKYYFAGASRIAMRKYTIPQSMTVEYLLGDHLGSTSITTDADGAKVSEIRYKPWGEIRYAWTSHPSTAPAYTLPTYTFTGQYSYLDDPSTSGVTEGFGLMFYNARWYDPTLGRFAQADTLVPGGVQGLDRYAYVNNAPINYVDPTGHFTSKAIWSYLLEECDGNRQCAGKLMNSWKNDPAWWDMITEAQAGDVLFGTVSSPGWKPEGFALTFSGTGDSVLTGIEGDHTTNPVTLVDIQKGHQEGCYAGGYPCFWRDYNWIGIARFRGQGKPTFPYLKPGYEIEDLGAPGKNGATQGGIIVASAAVGYFACQPFGGPPAGIACGIVTGIGGNLVVDGLDIEVTDHAYQVGPIYFNFQTDAESYTVTLEHIKYQP